MLQRLLLINLLFFSPLCFSGFSISPLKVEAEHSSKSAIITVTNTGDTPLKLQIIPKRWSQSKAGNELYEETNELLVFPRQVTIPAKGKQLIRLGFSIPPSKEEKSYRLFLEEIPVNKPDEASLKFVLAMSLPVFIKSKHTEESSLNIEQASIKNGSLLLDVVNIGNHYSHTKKIIISLLDSSNNTISGQKNNGWYVLANSQKSFRFALNRADCMQSETLAITIDNGEQDIHEYIPINSSHCSAQ